MRRHDSAPANGLTGQMPFFTPPCSSNGAVVEPALAKVADTKIHWSKGNRNTIGCHLHRPGAIPASTIPTPIPIPAHLFDSDSDSDSSHLGYDSDSDSNTIFMNDSDSDSDSYSIPTAELLTLILTPELYKFRFKYQPRCYYIK